MLDNSSYWEIFKWRTYFFKIQMDSIASKIAALGVPGLILLVVMAFTGWAGAAALTTALAAL